MPTLGTKGAELDLLIRQGATQGPYTMYVLDQADGSPIDITSATFRAEIRRTSDSPALNSVTFDFTITTPLDGEVTWSIPASSTVNLSADPVDELQPKSQYVWDMEVELSSGRVLPLLYGNVSVFREITKELE